MTRLLYAVGVLILYVTCLRSLTCGSPIAQDGASPRLSRRDSPLLSNGPRATLSPESDEVFNKMQMLTFTNLEKLNAALNASKGRSSTSGMQLSCTQDETTYNAYFHYRGIEIKEFGEEEELGVVSLQIALLKGSIIEIEGHDSALVLTQNYLLNTKADLSLLQGRQEGTMYSLLSDQVAWEVEVTQENFAQERGESDEREKTAVEKMSLGIIEYMLKEGRNTIGATLRTPKHNILSSLEPTEFYFSVHRSPPASAPVLMTAMGGTREGFVEVARFIIAHPGAISSFDADHTMVFTNKNLMTSLLPTALEKGGMQDIASGISLAYGKEHWVVDGTMPYPEVQNNPESTNECIFHDPLLNFNSCENKPDIPPRKDIRGIDFELTSTGSAPTCKESSSLAVKMKVSFDAFTLCHVEKGGDYCILYTDKPNLQTVSDVCPEVMAKDTIQFRTHSEVTYDRWWLYQTLTYKDSLEEYMKTFDEAFPSQFSLFSATHILFPVESPFEYHPSHMEDTLILEGSIRSLL